MSWQVRLTLIVLVPLVLHIGSAIFAPVVLQPLLSSIIAVAAVVASAKFTLHLTKE